MHCVAVPSVIGYNNMEDNNSILVVLEIVEPEVISKNDDRHR